jgi:transposase
MSEYFLGIDVAKATFDVALDMNTRVLTAQFDNNGSGFRKMAHWLDMKGAAHVHACMEATGRYWEELADFLHAADNQVSVVNPARIRSYAKSKLLRNKTDVVDARNIANFCRTQVPELWCPPPTEQRQLRDMVRRYSALQKMQSMERNRLKSGVDELFVVADLTAHIEYLEIRIDELWQAIKAHIDAHPWLARQHALLVTIPGVADLTAARLLGEIPDIAAFGSAKSLAAHAGVTPRHFTSGSSIQRYTPISRTGNDFLRALLYWPAITAMTYVPAVRALCKRLSERGKSNMAIICAAMRKLLHIVYGVINSGRPFDPRLAMPTKRIT